MQADRLSRIHDRKTIFPPPKNGSDSMLVQKTIVAYSDNSPLTPTRPCRINHGAVANHIFHTEEHRFFLDENKDHVIQIATAITGSIYITFLSLACFYFWFNKKHQWHHRCLMFPAVDQ